MSVATDKSNNGNKQNYLQFNSSQILLNLQAYILLNFFCLLVLTFDYTTPEVVIEREFMRTNKKLRQFIKVSGLLQPVDQRLIKKIQELVPHGVNRVSEMQRHLQYYVRREIFANRKPPEATNRRFFPTNVDVRNHMYGAAVQSKHSSIDQENLELKIKDWEQQSPEDKFFFRPYCHTDKCELEEESDINVEDQNCCDDDIVEIRENSQANNLLLVHQTQWQRQLLEKYGGDICLLDATYKTSRYALPTFFLCVKTNVDYCVVASFVTQQENADSIWEALHVLQDWNPTWNPSFFMVDFCEAEINAIERLFPSKDEL